MEQSFIFLKPDAVRRGLCGEIIERFERAGLVVTAMRLMQLTEEQADKFYPNDKEWLTMLTKKVKEAFAARGESFDKDELAHGKQVKAYLVKYVTSGPVLAVMLEGNDAIKITRKLIGSTDAAASAPGTIRGDYGNDSVYMATKEKRANMNLIHAAGDEKEAKAQIKMIFG